MRAVLGWLPVVAGVLVTLVLITLVWSEGFDIQISTGGWWALGLGVSVSVALMILFVRLMYISNARGIDVTGTDHAHAIRPDTGETADTGSQSNSPP
ncbi:MAG: hypothetical protein ACPGOY_14085 [Rhodospirillaceae bacterium]